MRFVTIADTHNLHHRIDLPAGDVLIHAGDATSRGKLEEIEAFGKWMRSQPFRHKIFVAGNHDFGFQVKKDEALALLAPDQSLIYLEDEAVILEDGEDKIKVWGSPWQPWFFDWAFNLRNHELKEVWSKIPDDTDVLVTHGPPHRILDLTKDGENVGCEHLRERVLAVKPKVHICGHIHEAYGSAMLGQTQVLNSSICNLRYSAEHKPLVFDIIGGQVQMIEVGEKRSA